MKFSLLTLSGLTVALLLSGCATESAPPASATPAPTTTAATPVATPAAAPAPAAVAAPAAAPAPRKVSFTTDVFFKAKKSKVDKNARAALDELATRLNSLSKLEIIVVTGHTDNAGSAASKEQRAQKRADKVKEYLVSKGVAANRIYTESKSDTQPVAYNNTEEGRARNSRVEVEVIGYKAK